MVKILSAIFLLSVCGSAQSALPAELSCGPVSNTSASPRYRGSRGNAPPSHVSKLPIQSLLYKGSDTRIYVRYMPWWGDPKHRDIGYRADDPEQVARQVADMSSRGIRGAIVDWYGPHPGIKHDSSLLLIKEAERQHFEFAVSEDGGALGDCQKHGCDLNQQLISDLRYAEDHFEGSPSYIRFDGRPAVFFFGLEKYSIDWARVQHSLSMRPVFFFRNSGSLNDPKADGAYAWIAPEAAGPSDPMGLKYLDNFYSKAQHSDKIVMGSAYKGFDDADASWGKGRVIDAQCGQTWLETFAEADRFYSAKHQLPALIIPTWNDYEEGTEIESGVDNCLNIEASLNNGTLNWRVSGGPEDTIDHYAVLAQVGPQWVEAADLSPGSHSIKLSQLRAAAEPAAVCVEAVGKPSIVNHFSQPIKSGNFKP